MNVDRTDHRAGGVGGRRDYPKLSPSGRCLSCPRPATLNAFWKRLGRAEKPGAGDPIRRARRSFSRCAATPARGPVWPVVS
jgi:hypothetical protein